MTDMTGVAKECFQVLLRYNYNVKLFDEDGMSVVEPTEARRMFAQSPNLMVSLFDADDDSSIKLLFGKSTHANDIDGLMQALRTTATKYNMTFDPKQYGKEIDAKDYQNLMSVSESLRKIDMHLCEGMYGTSRSSYLQLDNAKMIVHHTGRIDTGSPDGRARQIKSIYVENSSGLRYKLPSTNLAAGRALIEHVNKGGYWVDPTGQAILNSFMPVPEKPVTRLTLAEKNPVVQDFITWTEKFAPDRALMEYNDPYSPAEDGRYDDATESAITDFDPEDFAISDDARDILSGNPEGDDRDVSKREITSALSEYLRKHIELHDPNFHDSGFQDDTSLHSIVDAVYDRAAEAVQNAGYVIVDDVSNGSLDEFGGDDDDNDHTLTREDILLPNTDQGASLNRAVTKAVVHDDPINPDEEHPPGSSYIGRLKTLAGVNSGRPV